MASGKSALVLGLLLCFSWSLSGLAQSFRICDLDVRPEPGSLPQRADGRYSITIHKLVATASTWSLTSNGLTIYAYLSGNGQVYRTPIFDECYPDVENWNTCVYEPVSLPKTVTLGGSDLIGYCGPLEFYLKAEYYTCGGGPSTWLYETSHISYTVPCSGYALNAYALPSGAGAVTKSPNNPTYYDESVQLTPEADSDWVFDHWSGDASGDAAPLSVFMDRNKTIVANFIPTHTVSTPNTPSGPSIGTVGQSLSFSSGGASCSEGHSVEYQFNWGDGGGYSTWSSSTTRSHSYGSEGTYSIRAHARCSDDDSFSSGWSGAHEVHIQDEAVDLELKSIGTIPRVITPIGEHMNHGVIGQEMIIEISFAIHAAQLPAEGKTELWAGLQLIDYSDGHNPISTWPVFSSGHPSVLEEMIGEDVAVLRLSVGEERALNRGETVTKTFSYTVPDQWHDDGVLFADTLKVSVDFETPRYNEANYANNVVEDNIQISPSLDQQIDGLFLLLSAGLGAKGLPKAAAGAKLTGGFIKITKALVDNRPADAAIEFVKIWIMSVGYAYEPEKIDVTSIFLDTTNNVISFAGLLSGSKNAALSVLFGANVILKASAAGFESAKSLWESFALEHIIWLVQNGTLALSYAIDAGLTLREAIELGVLSLPQAVAEGYITASNLAESIEQGVCTVWDAITLGVVDIWWAIANEFCSIGEAIVRGFLAGWEWAATAGGSILPSAQLSSTLSDVEILIVDQTDRRTGIL